MERIFGGAAAKLLRATPRTTSVVTANGEPGPVISLRAAR